MSDERKPMTDEELAEIRELAEAATPGPWYGWFEPKENMIEARGAKWVMGLSPVSCPFTESLIETCGEDAILSFECPKQVLISTDDLEYMVAANPKTVLALLDEVKRLREEKEILEGTLDNLGIFVQENLNYCAADFIGEGIDDNAEFTCKTEYDPDNGCQKCYSNCWAEVFRKTAEEEINALKELEKENAE